MTGCGAGKRKANQENRLPQDRNDAAVGRESELAVAVGFAADVSAAQSRIPAMRDARPFFFGLFLGVALLMPAAACLARDAAERPAGASVLAETPAQKAERMKWWVEARFGMFVHWGPVSLKGTEIGWSRGREVPIPVYDNLYKQFNPVKFDAREYVALAKEAGVKYLTLTTKHHDGFSMFATKRSDYNITQTPFKRDVTRELADECQRQGLRFCTYYSIIDWYHPDYLPRGAGDKRPVKGPISSVTAPSCKGSFASWWRTIIRPSFGSTASGRTIGPSRAAARSTRCSATSIRS